MPSLHHSSQANATINQQAVWNACASHLPCCATAAACRCSTETSQKEDIATDLDAAFLPVPGLGSLHRGFFEAEDIVHAEVRRGFGLNIRHSVEHCLGCWHRSNSRRERGWWPLPLAIAS